MAYAHSDPSKEEASRQHLIKLQPQSLPKATNEEIACSRAIATGYPKQLFRACLCHTPSSPYLELSSLLRVIHHAKGVPPGVQGIIGALKTTTTAVVAPHLSEAQDHNLQGTRR